MNSWTNKLVFYGALILAYFKTAEAMVHFAPSTLFGWRSDLVAFGWAYLAAGLVEGVAAIAFGHLMSQAKDINTRKLSIVIVLVALVFSGLMNVIDTNINDGSMILAGTAPAVVFLRHLVILLPIIVVALFGLLAVVDNHYPDQQLRVPSGPVNRPSHRPQHSGLPAISGGNGSKPPVATRIEMTEDRFPT